MKRYLLFANAYYYPAGGWSDIRGDFDSIEEAELGLEQLRKAKDYMDWFQIVDTQRGDIVRD